MEPFNSVRKQPLRERIAQKAYELFEKRGCVHGHDQEDWFKAEQLVLAEFQTKATAKAKKSPSRSRRAPARREKSAEL